MGVYKGAFNKMNDKRFEVLFYGDVINCVRDETGKEYNLQELISILMEQQATIQSLKSDKAIAEDYANIFEKENVKLRKQIGEQQATIQQLQAKLREKEEDERLYANEILELRETNKEHIKFKSLGGNY